MMINKKMNKKAVIKKLTPIFVVLSVLTMVFLISFLSANVFGAKWTTVNSYGNWTFDDATNYGLNTGYNTTYPMGNRVDFNGSWSPGSNCKSSGCVVNTSANSTNQVMGSLPNHNSTLGGWSFWMNITTNGTYQVLSSSGGFGKTPPGHDLRITPDRKIYMLTDGGGAETELTAPNPLRKGVWEHVFVKINSTGKTFFINGVNVARQDHAGTAFFRNDSALHCLLGCKPLYGILANNTFDEVKFFQGNNALTDAQIYDLYTTENISGDSITPIVSSIPYPANITYNANVSSLSYTVSDDVAVDSCWYSRDGGATNSSFVTANTNFTNILSTSGSNNWTVYCNDSSNNIGQNSTVFSVNNLWFNSASSVNSFRITEFINRSGDNFTLGGQPYRLIGVDSYYLIDYATNHTYDDDGNEINNSRERVIEILNEAHYKGVNVIRTWCGAQGGGTDTNWVVNKTGGHYNLAEVGIGNYNETYFQAFDWLLSEASKRDIRIQCVPFNNWNDYGGLAWYVRQSPTTNKTYENESQGTTNWWTFHDQGFVDNNVIIYMQNYLNYTLNRNNTITGILYKNDPTIFSIMLMNEPRNHANNSNHNIIANWTKNMTTFFRTIDSNHLIATGIEGLGIGETWGEGTDIISVNNGTGTDYVTFAWNPTQWDYIAERIETSADNVYICSPPTIPCTLGTANVLNFWTNGTNFTYDNLYQSDKTIANYTPQMARHSYEDWISQNVKWATQILGMPILLQEFTLDQQTSDSLKSKVYNNSIHNFYSKGGDGMMYWNLDDDQYYYSTQYSSYAGKMVDTFSFFVSDDPTLKALSQATMDSFNFVHTDNNGGSWVNSLNNFKYDFTINVDLPSDRTINNCSMNYYIYNGSYYNVTQLNTSAVLPNTDYIFSRQFNSTDNNFTWYSECYSNNVKYNTSSSLILLGGTLPVINLINPENASFTRNNTNVTFSYNVTSDIDMSYCELYMDSVLNATDTSVERNSTQIFQIALPATTANHTWYVRCIDIQDNIGNSTQRVITVDTTNSSVVIAYPTATLYNNQIVAINYTASDSYLQSCWYSLNNGTTNTTIPGCTNVTGITSIEGSNTWWFWANDSAGNIGSSFVTFNVDTTNASVSIVYPTATFYKSLTAMNYTAKDTNLAICWYSTDLGITNITIDCNLNITGLTPSEGSNTLLMYANDTLGNTGSASVTFTLDTTFPLINFTNPTSESGTQVHNAIWANVTATDTNLANITIYLYNSTGLYNSTNSSTSPFFLNFTDLSDGTYYLNATVIDLVGNTNTTETRTITLDTTYPLIFYGIGTEDDFANLSQSNIYINTTWTEINFKNITFAYNSTLSYTSTSQIYFYNKTGLADGVYYYNVTICDVLNQCNTTDTRKITLDTTPPNIQFVSDSETSGSTISRNNITVNITATDSIIGLNNITIYLYNSTLSLINETNSTVSPLRIIFLNLSDGIYYFNATAYDNLNNFNYTETRSVTINTATTPSTPGTGGGGGVACTTNWICTGWSTCTDINLNQTRNCTKANELWGCDVGTKPEESRSCLVQIGNETITNETISETGEQVKKDKTTLRTILFIALIFVSALLITTMVIIAFNIFKKPKFTKSTTNY